MAIKLNSVKCPDCGASLPVEEGRTQVFCSYCGTKIIITNENEHIFRTIDEASVKQSDTDRMVRMRELDLEEQRANHGNGVKKVLTIIWIVLSLIILAICIVKWAFLDDFTDGFLMLFYLGGPVIGGGAYLIFKLLPEKENEKTLIRSGGIRFPKYVFPYSDKNYEVVHNSLKMAGFRNVTCINMHDLTFGLLQKPGRIESITANGEKVLTGGKVYYPDILITITYHGK